MEYIEVSAKTVDEAITKACIELGAASDRLDIQIISEGSEGFFGIGRKPAVVRAVLKPEEPEPEVAAEAPKKETPKKEPKKEAPKKEPKKEAPVKEESKKEDPKKEEPKKEGKKEEKKESHKKEAPKKEAGRPQPKAAKQPEAVKEPKAPQEEKEPVIRTEEEIAAMKEAAQKFLSGVFAAMELPVTITMEYNQQMGSLDVDFAGEDMGILIGKRGQTLDSLQYLTSLVVNKEQKEYVRVKLDTENYRKRRKETLENLARNIAYKVKKTRRPVSLEPMNPYERRIIHSSLQSNKYVETYSEGNEPYRHVVVAPKRG